MLARRPHRGRGRGPGRLSLLVVSRSQSFPLNSLKSFWNITRLNKISEFRGPGPVLSAFRKLALTVLGAAFKQIQSS